MKRSFHLVLGRTARALRKMARDLSDEQGGEVMEYVLIAGLISVCAIAVITTIGTKVLARWTSINSSM